MAHRPGTPDEQRRPTGATLTRNWEELLQEIRVTQTGVQILTGFLLTVPFSGRFGTLSPSQRWIYLGVLSGSVVTTGLVVAPVAFHRVLFRERRREFLVESANRLARAGLALLALTLAGAVLLVVDLVLGRAQGVVAGGAVLAVLTLLWWAAPRLAVRSGRVPRTPAPEDEDDLLGRG